MSPTTKILTAICIVVTACGCGNTPQKKNQEKIPAHKQFIRSLAFTGMIREKKYCEKCAVNKYQVIIHLNDIIPATIQPNDRSFPPYYQFDSGNLLNISVTQSLFEYEQEELIIWKQANSDTLTVSNRDFRLLSDQEDEWLPAE